MLSLAHLQGRRRQLLEKLSRPALLFAGGLRARNTPFDEYPYRADSNFLLFFDRPEPDSAALFDPDDGTVTLFLPERTIERALWEGDLPGFAEAQERAGVDAVLGLARLEEQVSAMARGRQVLSVGVMDERTTRRARTITGLPLDPFDPAAVAPPELVDALAALRLRKDTPEVAEIRNAADITREAFARAMRGTRPGVREQELAGDVDGWYARHGCSIGYTTILSVRGEVLHNHAHDHTLRDGDLVLLDSGAELPSGYGADVTRAWPANGRFEPDQLRVYETVLRAQLAAIELVRPGARWRDVHLRAAEVITEGLAELGLLRGSPSMLLERGAHALFFPHGVGHFLGLDTHDLRIFGDRVLYPGERKRSEQFGLDALRMDRDLEPGMVVTVEPGVYFVPAILHRREFRESFADAVDFEHAEEYLQRRDGRGFGGVRIEDDVLVTPDGHEILTPAIPKRPDEVEADVGGGAPGGERWS